MFPSPPRFRGRPLHRSAPISGKGRGKSSAAGYGMSGVRGHAYPLSGKENGALPDWPKHLPMAVSDALAAVPRGRKTGMKSIPASTCLRMEAQCLHSFVDALYRQLRARGVAGGGVPAGV